MHHFRHTVQLLVVVACLIWGGLQIRSEVFAQPASAAMVVTESEQDIESQYPDLPPAVARSIRSVVATQQVLNQATQHGVVASAVIVNDQQVLTAAHNINKDGRLACGNTSIVAPGMLTHAATSQDAVTHASAQYDKKHDLAVMTVQSSANFRDLPNITIADRLPEAGDTVYFVNFQPTADGKVRSPAAAASSNAAADYSKPAVFSGIVLGKKPNGIAIATGYGESYGLGVADNLVRKGASGGAIVNVRGELVGLSVSSESLLADRDASSLAAEYKVRLPASRYQVAYMQPVGEAAIERVQNVTVSCTTSQ